MGSSEKHDSSEGKNPPPFSVYKAQSKKVDTWDGKDDIATHDPHLNEDGEALYRFLLEQVETNKPVLRICIDGQEYSNRTGAYLYHQDFCFYIDIPIPSAFASHPVQWSLADSEPAYRGRSTREVEKDGKKENTGGSLDSAYTKQRDARRGKGYPPWMIDIPDTQLPPPPSLAPAKDAGAEEVREYLERFGAPEQYAWKSSKNLREWAQDYVTASRSLKEFAFQQETYGWDMDKLKKMIKKTIKEKVGYSGDIEISHWNVRGRIYVRPASTLSKLMSKLWHGGGIWKTCGVAYPLVGYADARFDEEGTVKTPAGFKKRVGMTEEDWYQKYEAAIITAVEKETDTLKPFTFPMDK